MGKVKVIGNKTKEEWELRLDRVRHLSEMLSISVEQMSKNHYFAIAQAVKDDFDALLDIYVLAEFIIDNIDWAESSQPLQ